MTSGHIKLVLIIIVIILLIMTRAWLFIIDTIINVIKRIFKIEGTSEHKWHIKRNERK